VAPLPPKKKKNTHTYNTLQWAVECCTEKGSSSWLSALPLERYGFALHKGEFIDAICFRYGYLPSWLPSHCVCGKDGENLCYRSAIQDDDARVDIRASSFWRCLHHLTLRVFNCFAASNSSSTLTTVFRKHE